MTVSPHNKLVYTVWSKVLNYSVSKIQKPILFISQIEHSDLKKETLLILT